MENNDNNPFFARKVEKNETKSNGTSPIMIGGIVLLIIIIISLFSTWRDGVSENKLIEAENRRQRYVENIVTVTHKINAGETVFFNFGEIIKRRIVKIKGDGGNGVRLDLKFFPSGITGYYEDDHPDAGEKDYTDSGVYVTSSRTITLELSLL